MQELDIRSRPRCFLADLCVPVLNRYDLLEAMIDSLSMSTVQPDCIHVVDNGKRPGDVFHALSRRREGVKTDVFEPLAPMGLASCWNWFITRTNGERFIVNDDLEFAPDSLEKMLATDGHFVSGLADTNAFSCFLLRDSCVIKIGLFDETISPGYAYFEDLDYRERMLLEGVKITPCKCGVQHKGSQTVKAMTAEQMQRHHKRFYIAQENFIAKWGYLPDGMVRQQA